MRIIGAAEIEAAIAHRGMIEAMRQGFRSAIAVPATCNFDVSRPDQPHSAIAIAPAWTDFSARGHSQHGYQGVMMQTRTPANAEAGMPVEIGLFVLLSGQTGAPLAMIDGRVLFQWRTAAVSALASQYLSRGDASRLLVLGSDAQAAYLARAHAAVRPISEILVWGDAPDAADKLAHALRQPGIHVSATRDLEGAVRGAHVITCSASAGHEPIRADWLSPGTHLDLPGTLSETRRVKATVFHEARLFVDRRDPADGHGQELGLAIEAGTVTKGDIAADLCELARGEKSGRRFHDQTTLFFANGSAAEDLAGAVHIFTQL
ncbi:ornithine cyclodeaminase [Tepidamorphus sp. 3E244]|uniref:ornithine cyclodeaminase n=1 Tax=Tepidamorphus sp. 3E244 TaxID=3385498 RepID=UPI0038FD1A0F